MMSNRIKWIELPVFRSTLVARRAGPPADAGEPGGSGHRGTGIGREQAS